MKPIIEVAVKNTPPRTLSMSQCPGIIPTRVRGMGAIIMPGALKLLNQPSISTYMTNSATPKARPRSLNTSRVMCISPSHLT